jgi:hypothetical protein
MDTYNRGIGSGGFGLLASLPRLLVDESCVVTGFIHGWRLVFLPPLLVYEQIVTTELFCMSGASDHGLSIPTERSKLSVIPRRICGSANERKSPGGFIHPAKPAMRCNAMHQAELQKKNSPELYKYAGQLIDSTGKKATPMRQ